MNSLAIAAILFSLAFIALLFKFFKKLEEPDRSRKDFLIFVAVLLTADISASLWIAVIFKAI